MVSISINQSFCLFCCAEQYSVNIPHRPQLPTGASYFLRYTYPDQTTKDAFAQPVGENAFTAQSPEYDHPCIVHVEVYASGQHATNIAEFTLDLVSPVEYLFRKFSANEFELSDKICGKMTSALLAMSLSYYYVMGEHVEKEEKIDEILSTMLSCCGDNMYMNTTKKAGDVNSEESITQFAKHFKLQSTLRYLSGGNSVGDLPVQLPKPLFPPVEKIPQKKPVVTPRLRVKTLPAGNSLSQEPSDNRPLSEYSVLNPIETVQDELYMPMDNPNTPPDNRPLSEYSALHPIETVQDEEYMRMDSPDRYSLIDDSNHDEDYFFMEQTDNKEAHKHAETSKSSSSLHSLPPLPPKPLPPKPQSSSNLVADDVYELCGSTTPLIVAATAATKKRGPPPKLPVPYRESHTMDNRSVNVSSHRKSSGDLGSSLESSMQQVHVSPPVKSSKLFQDHLEVSPASDPLPRKKYNPFHKSKAKQPSNT